MTVLTALTLILAEFAMMPPDNEPTARQYEPASVSIAVDGATRNYPYQLLRPVGADGPTPLVVFLHGAGERGNDNQAQLTYLPKQFLKANHLRDRPCHVLAMQCPKREQWAPYQTRVSTPRPPLPAMQAVIAAIKKVIAEEDIDHARVYLTGLSMGGYGSWDLAARHPDWFAAVVPICGGGQVTNAKQLTDVPIWAFHGEDDRVVPESESRRMVEAIRAAGGTPAYTNLPGVDHGSWHFAYGPRGAMEWMFAQRNPDPAALKAATEPSKPN